MKQIRYFGIVLAMGMSPFVWAVDTSPDAVHDPIAGWPVIQSAGGIQLGSAVQQGASSWKLPLQCDMSTNAPGTLIQKTLVEQKDKDIFISLVLSHVVWTLTPER